jgi:hypothetical protein
MIMDIKIDRENMNIQVLQGDKVLKTEELDADSFREYMRELCRDNIMLDALRLSAKKMKVKSYEFKEMG